MKKLRLVAVGKLKERYFSDAFDEYARRIGRFADFSVVETRESRSESVEEEAADMLRKGLKEVFPGRDLSVDRDNGVLKIYGDLSLD